MNTSSTPTLDRNREDTRCVTERKRVCDLCFRLREDDIVHRTDGYCKKCRYAARQKPSMKKATILAELEADEQKHEQWASNIQRRYEGQIPKNTPMPVLSGDIKVKKEKIQVEESCGTWNVPLRMYEPEWGEPLDRIVDIGLPEWTPYTTVGNVK